MTLLALTRVSAWEFHVTAILDFMVGGCCAAVAVALGYLARRFDDLPFRVGYVPFGGFLLFTSVAHVSFAFGLFERESLVHRGVLGLTAVCAAGTVVLLHDLIKRLSALANRERDAGKRQGELSLLVNELTIAKARAQELSDLKTQVFTNLSHELRTPLTLILGPLQRLRETAGLGAEQLEALSIVEHNAHLLLGHVTDLLELSRADAVGVMLDRRPTDVLSVLRALAKTFRSLAQDLGVHYEVNLPRMRRHLLVDPEKLQRVAMNLLANAFKFTPRGGRVTFEVALVGGDEGGRSEIVFSVDDSGPGIGKMDREAVFERFRQLDGKASRAFGGTGLGLAIVREFVLASSGSVVIEDSALGGARFVVSLPAERADAPGDPELDELADATGSAEMLALRARPTASRAAQGLPDLPLVLVVEDNADMNRFVSASLASEFRVLAAFDGRQALAELERIVPDLIVTDFMMPHMSGEEFVRALRQNAQLEDVPVLVLTARDDTELRVRVLSDGVQDWLSKPFTVTELIARARNLTSARRARAILRAELTSREFDVGELASQLSVRKRQLESLLESLSQALEQAELASRFKTSLLRLISHELRTPLGPLQLQLERLASGQHGMLNDAQEQMVVRMRRSLSRLTDTIQSLLEYARIESGRLLLNVNEFDVRELARGVLDDFAGQAESKGVGLRLLGAEDAAPFQTDCRLLRLVLVNLVSNALKFTERGEVTVAVTTTAERCAVRVRDTGPGIEASLRTTVFEPFFQGEPAQSSQGAGLGLSLVREMSLALGGSVELESEIGVGSQFVVFVPSAASSQRPLSPTMLETSLGAGNADAARA